MNIFDTFLEFVLFTREISVLYRFDTEKCIVSDSGRRTKCLKENSSSLRNSD
jgi:hypothetical protein